MLVKMSQMAATPEDIIGKAGVQRLKLAGFDIVPLTIHERETTRWTCRCGAVHAPKLGFRADTYADYGRVWHRPCVPPERASWYPEKTGFRPMLEDSVPLPARG